MGHTKEEKIINLTDALYEYTHDINSIFGITIGVHDEDLEEFTEIVKNNQNKDINYLAELLIDFRNLKKYTNDDLEEE